MTSLHDHRRDPTQATVSVIIPSYNSASVLPEAIDSVLCQTHEVDELIVVDDGSVDNTAEVCRDYGSRVRYICQENQGASAARNSGIVASGGAWLAFLDADDIWEPRKIELQLAALTGHPEADFAVTPTLAWAPDRETYKLCRYEGPPDPNVMRAYLLVRNILAGLCSSLLIRRRTIESVGGFASGKCCEDRRLAIDLLERHQAVLLEVPLVRQRPGPARITDPERFQGEMLSLIKDYDELYARLDPTGLLKRRALARVQERTGMHHLENGDLTPAARHLTRAVVLWPFMANPWRVLINAWLGRLRVNPCETFPPPRRLKTAPA